MGLYIKLWSGLISMYMLHIYGHTCSKTFLDWQDGILHKDQPHSTDPTQEPSNVIVKWGSTVYFYTIYNNNNNKYFGNILESRCENVLGIQYEFGNLLTSAQLSRWNLINLSASLVMIIRFALEAATYYRKIKATTKSLDINRQMLFTRRWRCECGVGQQQVGAGCAH